jgi:hypothetical protein
MDVTTGKLRFNVICAWGPNIEHVYESICRQLTQVMQIVDLGVIYHEVAGKGGVLPIPLGRVQLIDVLASVSSYVM